MAHDEQLDIVFVCTGNRARSPLAEALLRRQIDSLTVGSLALSARSRGLLELGPILALPEMQAVATELEVDLSPHRAHAIHVGELRDADLVLGFEPSHVAAAVIDGRSRRERTFTLLEFIDSMNPHVPAGSGLEGVTSWLDEAHRARAGRNPLSAPSIEDPLGRSRDTFRRIALQVDNSVSRLAGPLKRMLVDS